MQLAMVDNRIIPYEQLDDVYLDRGFYFGDGVYEVLRSYDGKIFALDDHLKRFSNSLRAVDITGIEIDDVKNRVLRAFEKADIPNAKIYFHVTRGSAVRNHNWPDDIEPNFFMTVTELDDGTKSKTLGIAVSTFPDWRWKRCDIKSLNLLANVIARRDAAKKGCDEAILVNEDNLITEGAASSLFAVIDNTLHTAPLTSNILPSITRGYILECAKILKIPVVEKLLTPQQAKSADELFIAVTTRDIVPVVKFDDVTITNGKPGPQTKSLMEYFKKFTR